MSSLAKYARTSLLPVYKQTFAANYKGISIMWPALFGYNLLVHRATRGTWNVRYALTVHKSIYIILQCSGWFTSYIQHTWASNLVCMVDKAWNHHISLRHYKDWLRRSDLPENRQLLAPHQRMCIRTVHQKSRCLSPKSRRIPVSTPPDNVAVMAPSFPHDALAHGTQHKELCFRAGSLGNLSEINKLW